MRVLVTGASGYIGTHLCAHLRLSSNIPYQIVEYDIADGADILNFQLLAECMRGCDAVVHLAAIPGVATCSNDPVRAWDVNYKGTVLVVLAARKLAIPKFIFASSGAAVNPCSVYGETKSFAEKIISKHLPSGLIYRLANVYGGVNFLTKKDSVLARFYRAVKSGKSVKITGNGTQVRDFIHVADVCDAIRLGLETKCWSKYPIDICTGVTTSIVDVAKSLGLEYEFVEGTEADLRAYDPPSPKLAAITLGFTASNWLVAELLAWRRDAKTS